MKSKWRGNTIYFDKPDNLWRYCSDDVPVSWDKDRPCGHCGKPNTEKGYDGCIGHIPAVQNACCGHGKVSEMYLQFNDGKRISGIRAYIWLWRRYLVGSRKRRVIEKMKEES